MLKHPLVRIALGISLLVLLMPILPWVSIKFGVTAEVITFYGLGVPVFVMMIAAAIEFIRNRKD